MLFPKLDELTRFLAWLGFVSTAISVLFFNILTIFFLKRDFGTYRNVLIAFSLLGFLFSSSDYIVHPMLHSYNAGFIYFTESHIPLISDGTMEIGLTAFCAFYGATMCFIAVQFLYRYWALFDAPKLKYFEGWRFFIWFIYSFTIGITWAIGIYHFLELDESSAAYLSQQLEVHYGMNISQVPCFASVIYLENGQIRWWNLCCTIEMTGIIGSQYLIICFCGKKMSVGMKEKIEMLSHTKKRLHTQFFKSLVLQILVPSIILFLPMISIIYLPLFNLHFSFPTGILFSAFALYPAIDIVIILYIVSDYSTAFKNLMIFVHSVICYPSHSTYQTETSLTVVPSPTVKHPVHLF